MRKKAFILFSLIMVVAFLAGCSSKTANELVTLQNDMHDNVSETMSEVVDEFEAKGEELDSGALSPEDFMTYYEEELQPVIDEKKQYIKDYEEPTTDEALEYYGVLTDGLTMALDVLDKSAEFVTLFVDDAISEDEIYEFGMEIDQLAGELEEKEDELLTMQEELESEYDIEFEEMELE